MLTVHANWRSGGTALCWSIARTYGCHFLCEAEMHPFDIAELTTDEKIEIVAQSAGSGQDCDPVQFLKHGSGLRLCPSDKIQSQDTTIIKRFFDLLLEKIPNVAVRKIMLMPSSAKKLALEKEWTLCLSRNFSQTAGSWEKFGLDAAFMSGQYTCGIEN